MVVSKLIYTVDLNAIYNLLIDENKPNGKCSIRYYNL